MISKSVKAKRRRNAIFYKIVSTIQISCEDKKCDFWIVSLPLRWNCSAHLEAYGHKKAVRAFRTHVDYVRKMCREGKIGKNSVAFYNGIVRKKK